MLLNVMIKVQQAVIVEEIQVLYNINEIQQAEYNSTEQKLFMLNQNELLNQIAQKHYTFKRAQLPTQEFGNSNVPQQRQRIEQEGVVKWIDVATKYCKQVLRLYPYDKYKKQYDQQVSLIQTEIRFKNSNEPGVKWTLLKSNEEINKFTQKWDKANKSNPIQSPKPIQNVNLKSEQPKTASKMDNLFNILSGISPSSNKEHQIFTQFLEQMLPPDKWNLKVLGQYQVRQIQPQSFGDCVKNTCCRPCIVRHPNYFITITTQNLLLSEQSLIDGEIQEAIPYTYALSVQFEVPDVNNYLQNFVALIKSGKTSVIISFQNLFDLLKFSFTFNQVKWSTPYFQKLRFSSFSPERQNNLSKFYNDAQQYFSDVHDEIEKAQNKICITGWCVTPYLLLKRPQNIETGSSRLDRTLERAAKRGVKIFIIVFQEPSLFVNNDSYNVWSTFQNMHQNFKVLRHPGLIIPQLWSHHEKSVIIDENVAFMGGIDICYGRWDTHDHPIYDKDGLWQGADYNNERQRSITEPRKYWESNLDRINEPRMPWHDIAIQVKGPVVIDLQRHFVQYWYFAIRDLSDDPHDYIRNFKNRYSELMRQKKDKKSMQQIIIVPPQPSNQLTEREKLFTNAQPTKAEMQLIQLTYANMKTTEPRSEDYTMRDRISSAKKSFKDLIQNKSSTTAKQILVEGFAVNSKPGHMKLQLCRSSSTWSTGIQTVQHSIYNAYMALIGNAKEFIYIENQFFMSHENQISEKIAERIRDAFRNRQKFKVIVMMPLLPGFEGEVTNQKAGVLRVQMHIQYEAINRHKTSIFQLLQDLPINMNDYIYFVGLRNHALFGKDRNIPKTEIIYVHSKLMIVDDRYMIIGSANINDRSLLGSRDSELAMISQDPNGKVGQGSIFQFRCRIFKEHFGMNEVQCVDLNLYWKKFIQISLNNTLIYRRVFGCYPDNTAAKFNDVLTLEKGARHDLYWKEIINLYGHYVEWPVNFLKNQDLTLSIRNLEYLAPITSFT